jgi:hypothetical protein
MTATTPGHPEATEALSRITARASGDLGVEVTVNLDGMIIDLTLTHSALGLGPNRLAEEICRLTRQAAAAALAEAMAILEPVAGKDLFGLIKQPEPAIAEDDFPVVQTWAVS